MKDEKQQNKLQDLFNKYKIGYLMKGLLKSKRHLKLTEFLFFTFLCSPRIYNMEIFTIFDEYFFGTSENKRLEQFSKIRNTLDNLNLNNDIEKIYAKKILLVFMPKKKKRKYEQLLNLKNMNQYAVAYELFASLLIILVRVNELNNFSNKHLSMESAFNLTMHNRITQLMKKNNEIKWTSILKYLDPQLRNVSQHFDISYNVENEVYIGKNIKGVEFEITKDDFLNKYLLPIQEVIFAILAVIFLLNIMWMDKSKGIYYIQLYFKAWYKNDEKELENYVTNLAINKILISKEYDDLTLEMRKSLYRNNFAVIKQSKID